MRLGRIVLLSALSMLACGNNEHAAPTTPTASSPPPASTPAEPPAEASAARPRKPFEVYSTCTDVVAVVFAQDPKVANAGKRTIAPSSSIQGPRENDGTQTVWLLDDKGEPLVKVHVTPGMKRVEIGKSCRTIDAR